MSLLQGAFIQTIFAQPQISDPQMKVEVAVQGLTSPTMAFLNATDILVLEKNGNVRKVTNGVLQEKPVLQITYKRRAKGDYLVLLQMVKTCFFI